MFSHLLCSMHDSGKLFNAPVFVGLLNLVVVIFAYFGCNYFLLVLFCSKKGEVCFFFYIFCLCRLALFLVYIFE